MDINIAKLKDFPNEIIININLSFSLLPNH